MALRSWRTGSSDPRPAVPLPPGRMPLLRGGRPLKRWHYVGCFTEAVLLCVASARIGPLPLSWWAVWDREQHTLAEHTARGRAVVHFDADRVWVDDGPVKIDLTVGASEAIETISPHGAQHIWTRKQGGVAVTGTVDVGDRRHAIDGHGIVDESAGYHDRHTAWRWSAGVGTTDAGAVAWNLVVGVHDAPEASERSVWVDGRAHEVGPVTFDGLDAIAFAEGGRLEFAAEATRTQEDNLGVMASSYEQPFGTFGGELPGAGQLRTGYGVMERHEVKW